jgi:HEAT repeat protein
LRGILTDQDPVVRLLAAETLADAENAPTVVGILAEALADSGADQAVRLTAVAGLGRILAAVSPGESPDDRVVASLARALPDADPDVAARARATLLRVTGEDLGDDPAAWIEWFSRPVEPMPIQETAPAP